MLRKFLGFFSSSVLLAAAQLCGAILVARIEGPAIFGAFVLAQAVATPIAMFFNLGLRQFFSTDSLHRYSLRSALRLKAWSAFSAIVVGVAAVSLIDSYFSGWALLFVLSLLYKTVEGAVELQIGVLQRNDSFGVISRLLTAKAIVYFSAFLVGELIFDSVRASLVLATAGVSLLSVYAHHWSLSDAVDGQEDGVLNLLKAVLPLGVGALAVALNLNLPRVIIEEVGSNSLFVFFAASLQIAAPLVLLLNIVCQFFLPSLARLFGGGEIKAFRARVIIGAISVATSAILVAIGFYWLGQTAVALIYGFHEEVPGVILKSVGLYISVTLLLGFANYALMATRGFRFQVFAAVATAVCISVVGLVGVARGFELYAVIVALSLVMSAQAFCIMGYSLTRTKVEVVSERG